MHTSKDGEKGDGSLQISSLNSHDVLTDSIALSKVKKYEEDEEGRVIQYGDWQSHGGIKGIDEILFDSWADCLNLDKTEEATKQAWLNLHVDDKTITIEDMFNDPGALNLDKFLLFIGQILATIKDTTTNNIDSLNKQVFGYTEDGVYHPGLHDYVVQGYEEGTKHYNGLLTRVQDIEQELHPNQ